MRKIRKKGGILGEKESFRRRNSSKTENPDRKNISGQGRKIVRVLKMTIASIQKFV
ncbi:MAG: hypothetical protein FMNOHCHN_00614 [Ignavibacteriaceae bacterium]|nr:hypothetical protein [Ignavibacteriaceae bacterium]